MCVCVFVASCTFANYTSRVHVSEQSIVLGEVSMLGHASSQTTIASYSTWAECGGEGSRLGVVGRRRAAFIPDRQLAEIHRIGRVQRMGAVLARLPLHCRREPMTHW